MFLWYQVNRGYLGFLEFETLHLSVSCEIEIVCKKSLNLTMEPWWCYPFVKFRKCCVLLQNGCGTNLCNAVACPTSIWHCCCRPVYTGSRTHPHKRVKDMGKQRCNNTVIIMKVMIHIN